MPLGLDVFGVVVQFVGIFLALAIAWHQHRELADSQRALKTAVEKARQEVVAARNDAEAAREETKRYRDKLLEAEKD
ncbi:hypothetical protein L209DRAFT_760480 [Thermothelomyces heterothallicus CBS 203.75]